MALHIASQTKLFQQQLKEKKRRETEVGEDPARDVELFPRQGERELAQEISLRDQHHAAYNEITAMGRYIVNLPYNCNVLPAGANC